MFGACIYMRACMRVNIRPLGRNGPKTLPPQVVYPHYVGAGLKRVRTI